MLTALDKRWTTAQEQDMPRHRRPPHCGPCTVVSCRKDRPSSPKKWVLNSQKICRQIVRVKTSPNRDEMVLKRLFETMSIANEWNWQPSAAAIATLPQTSFPDNNFASCRLDSLGQEGSKVTWSACRRSLASNPGPHHFDLLDLREEGLGKLPAIFYPDFRVRFNTLSCRLTF